jgi:hypothetical protein
MKLKCFILRYGHPARRALGNFPIAGFVSPQTPARVSGVRGGTQQGAVKLPTCTAFSGHLALRATWPLEGGSVNRCFKTPVIIANTGYRKGLSRKLGCGKIAALFLHVPTGRGDRPASPPEFFRISLFEKLFRPGNTYLPSPPLARRPQGARRGTPTWPLPDSSSKTMPAQRPTMGKRPVFKVRSFKL